MCRQCKLLLSAFCWLVLLGFFVVVVTLINGMHSALAVFPQVLINAD